MLRRWIVLVMLSLGLCIPVARADEEKRFAVQVDHTGEDLVGQRLAYEIREAIRGSHAYQLEQSPEAIFTIHLVTLDPDDGNKGLRSIAAITITMRNFVPYEANNPQTWMPMYMNTEVVIVGSNQLKSMAHSIIADFDVAVEQVKQSYSGKN
jgi:hypothetical protein